MTRLDATTAIALIVTTAQGPGERYFCRFAKGARLLTAWSLAGAGLFGPWQEDEIAGAERRLRAKGYRVRRATVALVVPSPGEGRP